MQTYHKFGGEWTEKKLECLKKYLKAYTKIFHNNPRASFFNIIYLDAFAGTGYRTVIEERNFFDFPLIDDNDAKSFQKGSVQIALENDPPFDKYIFIDKNPMHLQELKSICDKYPDKKRKIEFYSEDANLFINNWCQTTNWNENRAVVFLDPYGMQVQWPTIEAIAYTKAIDLWILFPLGQAVNRLLPKKRLPEEPYAKRLTSIFGTEDWKCEFYKEKKIQTIFGEETVIIKDANYGSISKFFIDRLRKIFEEVSNVPQLLYNSRNVPIYLLCFAAGNPKGAKTAVKIANDIMKVDYGFTIEN